MRFQHPSLRVQALSSGSPLEGRGLEPGSYGRYPGSRPKGGRPFLSAPAVLVQALFVSPGEPRHLRPIVQQRQDLLVAQAGDDTAGRLVLGGGLGRGWGAGKGREQETKEGVRQGESRSRRRRWNPFCVDFPQVTQLPGFRQML